MMVTWVRGAFKNIRGKLTFDPAHPEQLAVETSIDVSTCWTGEPARDNHLRSPDFLSCESFPEMRFKSTRTVVIGPDDYQVTGDLTIRGIGREVTLDVRYLGMAETPWWEDGVDKGPKTRAGFTAKTRIDRYEFGVNWNDKLPDGGVVVSPQIDIVIDVEAIKQG